MFMSTQNISKASSPQFDAADGISATGWEEAEHPQIREAFTRNSSKQVSALRENAPPRIRLKVLLAAVTVFLVAASARLFVLYYITGTDQSSMGWFVDAFHHWQIGYLSKEIGFQQGFLRLWDFKGMEYFWGLLHPLALAGLFGLTGSIDIMVPRILSLVSGSVSVVALYFLVKRYFNVHAAIAVALLVSFNPVIALADISGMQEPSGIALLLVGLLFWPKRPIVAGIFLGSAGMVRAEFWVFGLGLAIAALWVVREGYGKWGLLLGWLIPTLLYMKYLAHYTGNAIYPVYWYFVGDAAGGWMADRQLLPIETSAVWASRIILPIVAIAAVWVLRKRPRYSLLILLGIGELIFLCLVFGFSAFVRGFTPRLLFDRIFLLAYISIALFAAIILLGYRTKKIPITVSVAIGWLGVIGLAVGSQILWQPILGYYQPYRSSWDRQFQAADRIADYYSGGVISMPEYKPAFTYHMARTRSIPVQNLESQMYDPFSYLGGEPFDDWSTTRAILKSWFTDNDIRLLVVHTEKDDYRELLNREPEWFEYQESVLLDTYDIYLVRIENSENTN